MTVIKVIGAVIVGLSIFVIVCLCKNSWIISRREEVDFDIFE